MTIQNIDFGTAAANDGEPISTAFQKIQDNFEDLYNGIQTSEVSAIASAATCDIGAVTTPVVRITGTTTITSFGTSTYTKKVVIFVGSLTLTHNATSLILPGAANITTQAGDTCTAISDGSGYWRVFAYQTANRTGSGKQVFDTSPTLATPTLTSPTMTTPTLGVATATSINKVTITAPATGSTLTIADGKTATFSNTLTFSGTDGKSLALTNGLTVSGNDGTLSFGAASKTLTINNSLGFSGTDASTLDIGTGGTLGTAAFKATGTSGNTVPLLDGTNTWSGQQTWAAGTTSVAPFKFQSGTNLTTAAVGAAEFDGTAFYLTAAASSRQVVPAMQISILSGNATGSNTNVAQSWFGDSTSQDVLTVQAATTYRFKGMLIYTRSAGTTSHTNYLQFANSGCTFTSFFAMTNATTTTGAPTNSTTPNQMYFTSASNLQVTGASTSATENVTIKIEGVMRINAGGTFIPQFVFDNAPGGAPTILANTFFELWPIGSNTVQAVGNWA